MTPRQAFVADLFQIIGWGAGVYSLGVSSLFGDLWGIFGLLLNALAFGFLGHFVGAVVVGHFRSSTQRKLNEKQEKHGR